MRGRENFENCIEVELEAAKEALFSARTIKEVRFWQEKIKYLQSLMRQNINRENNKKK